MKQVLVFLFMLFSFETIQAQTITGTFPQLAGEEMHLKGFDGFESYKISFSEVSQDGTFILEYSEADYGMGQLVSADGNPFIVVLSGENIELKGEAFSATETVEILSGKENQLFEQYASEHPRREQVLSAWIYLENIYRSDSLFAVHDEPMEAIKQEKERIRQEDEAFLNGLNSDSYVSWYLPVRKLVSSVSVVAQYRTDEIPGTIEAFRELDYADERLYKSGLLADVVESHIWLIENSGRSLASVFVELNRSIDGMIENLSQEEAKLNEISEFLFDLLENRSLFRSSEYLALSLLNNKSERIDFRLASKLEIYRAMKPGSTAPDIVFTEATHKTKETNAERLSELQSDYTLVVFAAGWCPHCREMIPELTSKYSGWRNEGVEVLLVSLDESPDDFTHFTSSLPFISTTDFQKWESPIVQDFYVHDIPSMILLDSEQEILIHPNSIGHMDSWVEWYLVEGNR